MGLKESFLFYLCYYYYYYYYVFSNKPTKCMKHVKSISGLFQRVKLWEVNYHYKVGMLLTLVKKKNPPSIILFYVYWTYFVYLMNIGSTNSVTLIDLYKYNVENIIMLLFVFIS